MQNERKKVTSDSVSFAKDEKGKWWWMTARMRRAKLTYLHKVAIEFGEEKSDSISIKPLGKDKGKKPWKQVPDQLTHQRPRRVFDRARQIRLTGRWFSRRRSGLLAARGDVGGIRHGVDAELMSTQHPDQAGRGSARIFFGLVGEVARETSRTRDAAAATIEGVLPQTFAGRGETLHRLAIEGTPTKRQFPGIFAVTARLGTPDGVVLSRMWLD